MIDNVSVNSENLIINKGEGSTPSQPPSPTAPTTTAQSNEAGPAVKVDLTQGLSQDIQGTQIAQQNAVSGSSNKEGSDKELEEKLKQSVETLNDKLTRLDREVQFKVDKRINKNYISVIDKKSKEIIREFPPEEIRAFIARFDEINEKLQVSQSTNDIKSLIINLEV